MDAAAVEAAVVDVDVDAAAAELKTAQTAVVDAAD